jgi:hypothetical protein
VRFALDHVVVAVHDLERARADYRAQGFTVTPGGTHPPPRTSRNALVVFEDGSYLELITWTPPNPAERWSNLLQRFGEGYIDFALVPEDVPRAIEEAKSRGLDLNGPIPGARLRPDGREVKWQTARQATFDLPFLCGDVTPREWRVPEGECRRHANRVRGIRTVIVAVADRARSSERYAALLGRHSPEGRSATGDFEVGATSIILTQQPLPPRGEGVVSIEWA